MKSVVFLFFTLFSTAPIFAQTSQKKKFFLDAGYGLAGSFFVRSYDEPSEFSGYREFSNKRFLGTAQNIALGWQLSPTFSIRAGLQFQHFTKKIAVDEVVGTTRIILDHEIHHRDYMWYGIVNRSFKKGKNEFHAGVGLYYLRPKQEEVEIRQPNFFMNLERTYENSQLEELGSIIEAGYQYQFQPKVGLGIRGQFYYTISAGYAESVALYPFINITF